MWKKSLDEFNRTKSMACAAIGFVVGAVAGIIPGLWFGGLTESLPNGVGFGLLVALGFAYWGYRAGDNLVQAICAFAETLKESQKGRRL